MIQNRFDRGFDYDDPLYYHKINWLTVDSYDNLWIFKHEGRDNDLFTVDLYDKTGNFRKTFSMNEKVLANNKITQIKVMGEYLYAHSEDKDGVEHVYKYRIPKKILE
jgi:hypothetical protein